MVFMYIKVKDFSGKFLADVTPFNKYCKGDVVKIMQNMNLPVDLDMTLQQLKNVAKDYDDSYPDGFKHIDGTFCHYYCVG